MQVTAQNETEKQIVSIMQEMASMLILKNRDYANASFNQGVVGNVIHLDDKITRYKNLVLKQIQDPNHKPSFESIQDTLRDIIGYAAIGVIVLLRTQKNGENFLGVKNDK